MKKRILSIALALIMVLALLPSAALAADADEVDYSPYVRLIRILSHDEATDVMYGTFVDFDDDGSAELVLTYPTRGRSMLQVWTLKTYEDGTKVYVNYGRKDYRKGTVQIPAREYLVERRGKQ